MGPGRQPDYINTAARLRTALRPLPLLRQLQRLEDLRGRIREVRWGPRTLDLDLLLHGTSIVDASGVSVPHPRLHERAFVLVPLAEIAPEVVHPVLNRTMFELAEGADRSGVSLMR